MWRTQQLIVCFFLTSIHQYLSFLEGNPEFVNLGICSNAKQERTVKSCQIQNAGKWLLVLFLVDRGWWFFWHFFLACRRPQNDASYTVGVALYDATGQRLCDGTTGQRAPQAETDWWLQVPLQGCPLLPLGWRITEDHNWWFQYVSMVFRCFNSERFKRLKHLPDDCADVYSFQGGLCLCVWGTRLICCRASPYVPILDDGHLGSTWPDRHIPIFLKKWNATNCWDTDYMKIKKW